MATHTRASADLGWNTSVSIRTGYEVVAARTWQVSPVTGLNGAALGRELIRHATLAPSSHNTQCWKFALDPAGRSIAILPDLARRCPAVAPDDHHVFVSLGCATENLIQAALAHGLEGDAQFGPADNAVRVTLAPTRAQTTPLFTAIPLRQCTRGDYDGTPLSGEELALLQRAGSSDSVRLLLHTERGRARLTMTRSRARWFTPPRVRFIRLDSREGAAVLQSE